MSSGKDDSERQFDYKDFLFGLYQLLRSPSFSEFYASVLLHSGIPRSGIFILSFLNLLDSENVNGFMD